MVKPLIKSEVSIAYVSKYDPDKSNPTVFHIAKIEQQLILEMILWVFKKNHVEIYDSDSAVVPLAEIYYYAVKFGLRCLDNFTDTETRGPVNFKAISMTINSKDYKVVSDETMRILPQELLEELATVIMGEGWLIKLQSLLAGITFSEN